MVRPWRLLLALVAALLASSCGGTDTPTSSDRLQVVTTVSPITSIVANIAGAAADVSGLIPEGTNSHTFEPPPSAAKVLSRADVVFVNGLQLEDPVADLASASKAKGARIVSLGDAVLKPSQYIYDFSFPKAAGKPNPHLWTSPVLAKRYAEIVEEALTTADPANGETYSTNLAVYSQRLDDLDAALRAGSDSLAPERRRLLTYHDAYAYFAREYGWKVIGAIQVSDFNEPTARELVRLIEQIKDEKVPAIFGSEVFPSPVLEQLGRETGVRYVDDLRDDDLPGQPGDALHTYLALMQFDYVTIIEALGGDASALKALDVSDVAADRARYPQ